MVREKRYFPAIAWRCYLGVIAVVVPSVIHAAAAMQALVEVSVSPKAWNSIKVNPRNDSISYEQNECCVVLQLGSNFSIQLVKKTGLPRTFDGVEQFVGVEQAKLAAILNYMFRRLAAFSDLSLKSRSPPSPFPVTPLHLFTALGRKIAANSVAFAAYSSLVGLKRKQYLLLLCISHARRFLIAGTEKVRAALFGRLCVVASIRLFYSSTPSSAIPAHQHKRQKLA